MEQISVVIPVMRWDLVLHLLEDIESNTKLPEKVILINNSRIPPGFPKKFAFNTEIFDVGKNIGVNAAWNYAIRNCWPGSHLSVLNDDIRICRYFFELAENTFRADENIGVVCPNTVDSIEVAKDRCFIDSDLRRMRKREGWAFTIRNTLRPQLPLIPDELFIFFGDDWIWTWTHELGFIWVKDFSNVIYHRVGGTLRQEENRPLRAVLNNERKVYRQLIRTAIEKRRKS
jgi:hypothetical protein